ncbi:aromatic amino acid ammonia-lyase [Hymenobacter aerilatus]|uniref:Aromatic amino acid ammonia-lyase n=1 Tax=Hymenobacter aerilatus TaxID=2932251 RepID=A0A8T9T396_9BACT|nr:aromatic amino acid lyase [Hymenobacter aerilatus]UOR07443.1 aromatic amino acid ammonia-lyase [Hymenobacter aerilatus]
MAADFLLSPTTPLTLPTLRTLLAGNARVVTADTNAPAATTTPVASVAPLLAAACGVGAEVPRELVRLMLVLQAGQQQRCGASAATVRRLLDFYNREVLPVVYQQGGNQVGLAHLSLPLFGLGEVNYQGYRLQTRDVLELFGWAPLQLADADASALLVGSGFTLAYAVQAWLRAEHLVWVADNLGSLSQGNADPALPSSHAACHAALVYVQQLLEEALTVAPTPANQQLATKESLAPPTDAWLALGTLLLAVAELGSRSAWRTELLLRNAAPTLTGLRHPVGSLVYQNTQLSGGASAGTAAEIAINTHQLLDNAEQLLGIELLVILQQPTQLPATAPFLADAREQLPVLAEHQLLYPAVHAAAQFVHRYIRPEQAM